MQPHELLEREWAEFNDLNPAGMVACSSGTAALHLALEALDLPPGSEVVTSDFNMVAVPRAIALAGLTPVFVDCDERLLMGSLFNLDWSNVSAVIYVHIYGRRIAEVDGQYGLNKTYAIVEDLAEAHGIKPGLLTDAACWSFYKNKIVAGEEGGAVWFRDPKRAEVARELRCLGFTAAHDFMHRPRGHNYRLANCLASKILSSFKWADPKQGIPCLIPWRRSIELMYDSLCPSGWKMPLRHAPWVYDLRVPGLTWDRQAEVVKALNEAGIAARMSFKPMSMQAEFQGCRMVAADRINGTAALLASKEVFYLPLTPGEVTRQDAERAFEIIRRTVGSPDR